MASPPFNISETVPADNGAVSAFPAQERTFRDIVEDALAVEHDMNTAGSTARHKFGTGSTTTRNTITDWVVGSLWFNTDTLPATLQRVVSVGPVVWENVAGSQAAAAPRGWIDGLTTKRDPGDVSNDIYIHPGEAASDTFVLAEEDAITAFPKMIRLNNSRIKKFDVAWAVGNAQGGLDVGSVLTDAWYFVYVIMREDTGVVDALVSLSPDDRRRCTFSEVSTSPVLVGATGHGYQNGTGVIFSTTGSLPTGLTPGTRYYVINRDLANSTFNVSATYGGAGINVTAGTQSGSHTVTTTPTMPANYTLKRRIAAILRDTSVNKSYVQNGDQFEFTAAVNESTATSDIAATELLLLGAPPGIVTAPIFHVRAQNTGSDACNVLIRLGSWESGGNNLSVARIVMSTSDGQDNMDVIIPPVVWTNRKPEVWFQRTNSSGILDTFSLDTHGWIDPRGKNFPPGDG